MHSVAITVPCGSAAPWQSAPHTSHSLQIFGILADAEKRKFRQDSKEGAERAENAAVKARVDEIQGQRAEKHDGDERAPLEVALALVEPEGGVAGRGKHRNERPRQVEAMGSRRPIWVLPAAASPSMTARMAYLILCEGRGAFCFTRWSTLRLRAEVAEGRGGARPWDTPRLQKKRPKTKRQHDERQRPPRARGGARARREPSSGRSADRSRGTTARHRRGCRAEVAEKIKEEEEPQKDGW